MPLDGVPHWEQPVAGEQVEQNLDAWLLSTAPAGLVGLEQGGRGGAGVSERVGRRVPHPCPLPGAWHGQPRECAVGRRICCMQASIPGIQHAQLHAMQPLQVNQLIPAMTPPSAPLQ